MKIFFTSTNHSRDQGTFYIQAMDDNEALLIDKITNEFNKNQYITCGGGDDYYTDFIYEKAGLDTSMVRKIWKQIKKEI